jgi:hypothetical protein
MAKKQKKEKKVNPDLKISHHFKLAPNIKKMLDERSEQMGLTKTGYVEYLIAMHNK